MTATRDKLRLIGMLAAGAALPVAACTSWMIHPSCSATGRMIVHKCRDNKVGPLDADILYSPHGVKWMRLGANKEALFAVSEKGIATVMNDGDPMTLIGGMRPLIGAEEFLDQLRERTQVLILSDTFDQFSRPH